MNSQFKVNIKINVTVLKKQVDFTKSHQELSWFISTELNCYYFAFALNKEHYLHVCRRNRDGRINLQVVLFLYVKTFGIINRILGCNHYFCAVFNKIAIIDVKALSPNLKLSFLG